MRIGAVIQGSDRLQGYLRDLTDKAKEPIIAALQKGAILIHAEAVGSIQEHRSVGQIYKRGSISHAASTPGSPPNTDTGVLAASIQWEMDEAKPSATIGTNLEYGLNLEFGTQRFAARPWLLPAYTKHKKDVLDLIRKGLQESFKKK